MQGAAAAAATGISEYFSCLKRGRSVQQKQKTKKEKRKEKKTQKKASQENSGANRVGDLSKVSK